MQEISSFFILLEQYFGNNQTNSWKAIDNIYTAIVAIICATFTVLLF